MRRLIINADDFGHAKHINDAVLDLHERGVVTSTTVMTNEPFFGHAVQIYPRTLGLGVHLNLTWGRSMVTGARFSPMNRVKAVLGKLDPVFVEKEYRRQIETLVDVGIQPDHLDSHHHLHAFSPMAAVIVKLAKEYNISKIRWPKELPTDTSLSVPYLKQRLIGKKLGVCQLTTTDNFFGILHTGRPSLKRFLSYLDFEGSAEICCHPSKGNSDSLCRLEEYMILKDPRFKQEILAHGIGLISFRDL